MITTVPTLLEFVAAMAMSQGGINRGGGESHPAVQVTDGRRVWELLSSTSNTGTAVAGAVPAAAGGVPKVSTAVAGAVAGGIWTTPPASPVRKLRPPPRSCWHPRPRSPLRPPLRSPVRERSRSPPFRIIGRGHRLFRHRTTGYSGRSLRLFRPGPPIRISLSRCSP